MIDERMNKMKVSCISVKFEPKWILTNQVSGKSSVVDDVLKIIKEQYPNDVVITVNKEFHQCKLIVAAKDALNTEDISTLLKKHVTTISDTDIGIEVEDVDKEQLEKVLSSVGQRLSEEEQKFFENEFHINFEKENEKNMSTTEDSSKEQPKDLNVDDLIGLDNLKKWMNEINKISSSFREVTTKTNVIKNISYLISVNRGNGLSTILQLMTETLKNSGLVEFAGKRDYIEWKLTYSENPNDFNSFEGLLRTLSRAEVTSEGFKGIVSIDVEEWLDYLTDKRFDLLLKFVWDNRDDIVFVFSVPFVENTVLDKLYDRIDDVISTRIMKFVPPSDEQYFAFLKKNFENYNMTVDEESYNSFVIKITTEKNDGKFYGFNTVRKISNEILYSVIAEAAKSNMELPTNITSNDFKRIYDLEDNEGLSGLEQLNGMVALTEVKNKVHEILSTVKLQKELHAKDNSQIKPCFHMMFTGNPGTGKTVVARIIGRIFKEEGLLEIGNFYEVSRKDFIGKFVGHTAPKTMEICRNAYGSVLFIDEAYLLADDRDGYSGEAIGTLIAEMENNRDKMIVIFAGYEKELEELFDMNPGLRDRIPYKIDFPNYNRNELKEIFYIQLKNKVKHNADFDKKVEEFFSTFPDDVLNTRDFSNGRFVRNLAERIVSKAALRFEMSGMDIDEFELTDTDFNVAVSDTDFQKLFNKVKHVKTIGF